jgi:hypothetical protein
MNLPCADVAQRALRRATTQDATAAIACVRNLIDVPVVILIRDIFWLGDSSQRWRGDSCLQCGYQGRYHPDRTATNYFRTHVTRIVHTSVLLLTNQFTSGGYECAITTKYVGCCSL